MDAWPWGRRQEDREVSDQVPSIDRVELVAEEGNEAGRARGHIVDAGRQVVEGDAAGTAEFDDDIGNRFVRAPSPTDFAEIIGMRDRRPGGQGDDVTATH